MKTTCEHCGREYEYQPSQGMGKTLCRVCIVTRARHRAKRRAIVYKGGGCQQCGYNKCDSALGFNHEGEKDFQISYFITRAWKILKTELDKCVLLCANCHAEVHYNERDWSK